MVRFPCVPFGFYLEVICVVALSRQAQRQKNQRAKHRAPTAQREDGGKGNKNDYNTADQQNYPTVYHYAAGYVVVKAHILSAGESMILSKLSLYLIMPCVILNAFQVELTDEITAKVGLILAFIAAILIHIVLIGIGGLCGRVFHANVVEKASIVYSNAGNLIIPIVTSVLGPEWVIYSSAFWSVQLIFIWSHGVGLFSSGQKFHFKKILLNANMISIFVGMLMLICRIKLPPVISEVTSSVGSMIGPISMIIAGMLIANMDFKQVFFSQRIYLCCCFARSSVRPLCCC